MSVHLRLCFGLQHSFSAVIHFAGLKAVGESVAKPLLYYRVNLTAAMNLIEVSRLPTSRCSTLDLFSPVNDRRAFQVMQAHGVHNLIFSSSATVYGDPQRLPIDEQHPVGGCTNPYGKTKYFIEEIISDHCLAEKVPFFFKTTSSSFNLTFPPIYKLS